MVRSNLMKLGIMGEQGSFTEIAAREYARKVADDKAEIMFLVSAERVLTALEAGEVDRAIFPIENSNGGIVIEAVHAMAKHRFQVERMFEIEVAHQLLVIPGALRDSITIITSHDQAIKQCRMYLKRLWGHVDIQEYADTALAAKDLAAGTLAPHVAVIASQGAADLYGLEVIEPNIQDLKYNYTTFVAATKLD